MLEMQVDFDSFQQDTSEHESIYQENVCTCSTILMC